MQGAGNSSGDSSFLLLPPVHIKDGIDMCIVAWVFWPDEERSSNPNLEKLRKGYPVKLRQLLIGMEGGRIKCEELLTTVAAVGLHKYGPYVLFFGSYLLLKADRGPILEVIVSRMRYISSQTEREVRFVGLSTALANAGDLADWLGVGEIGLFNFKPSVRPVPLEVHIQGYPGKFYCPRMNSMNKPAYAAICTHSPTKPVLIFVSSPRQTRLTALDLIQFAASDEHPRQFLSMPEDDLQMVLSQVTDNNLRHTLQFGIGLHHAGLNDKDRSLVEELFANNKIQAILFTWQITYLS
ncbi:activating signal cointegrator 1 complex subunit 3-like [Pyrus ussuriensis x Pyrus communis]|uniref:Activating signal cointegrator 1 complex subunit 3-like n=1 Tax=Pyrus ussuriensis x Pyrus communis TaxID=2448454 RepID=A0A5N5GQN2_9ROSA|nr:activating signal cointegrator 1 complex subunit 3-like [Pyrus ussuriensis x Pyrus communis]